MAVNKFTGATNKKVSANGNWSLGHKPTVAEDVEIEEGKEPELNAVLVGRSLFPRKNVKWLGASNIEIGNSEKPEGPAGAAVILAQESGVTWPFGLKVRLVSTYTATALSMKIAPSWWGQENGIIEVLGTATCEFAEEGKVDAEIILGGGTSKPTLALGSATVTIANKTSLPSFSGNLLFNGGGTFSGGTGTLKVGEWYSDGGTTTVVQGTSTIIIADGVRGFFEGVRTYFNLTFEGGRPQLRSSFTLEGALAFNRTNGFAGIGFTLFAKPLGGSEENESVGNGKFTVTLKKGASVTTNGTAEHPAEVVGTSEAERSQLVLEEDIEVKGVLNWKYIEAVGHTIYAPEATSITGCKNVVKEAKTGGTVSLAAVCAIKLGDSAALAHKQALSATAALRLGTLASAAQKQSLAAKAALTLGTNASVRQRQSLAGVAHLTIGASGAITTVGGVLHLAASCALTLGASAAIKQKQSLGGSAHLTIGTLGQITHKQRLSGVARLTLGTSASLRQRSSLSATVRVALGAQGSITVTSHEGERRHAHIHITSLPSARIAIVGSPGAHISVISRRGARAAITED